MPTPSPLLPNIAWATDEQLHWLTSQPLLCKNLFGQRTLVVELIKRMRGNDTADFWYRPACVELNGFWAAAGGFKGPPYNRVVEIGYRVHPEFRRLGLASALVRWLCRAAAHQGVHRVVAVTMNNNVGSQAVLAQNGFVHTGDLLSDSQHWLQRWQYSVSEPIFRQTSSQQPSLAAAESRVKPTDGSG